MRSDKKTWKAGVVNKGIRVENEIKNIVKGPNIGTCRPLYDFGTGSQWNILYGKQRMAWIVILRVHSKRAKTKVRRLLSGLL